SAAASRGTILLDGCKKILDDGLVAAKIADGGGRSALVFVRGGIIETGKLGGGQGVAEIGGNDAVVFEDDRAFGAGDFDAAGVTGISGGRGMENSECTAGEFERGDSGVFGFDFVKQRGRASLHTNHITEQPEEQVD